MKNIIYFILAAILVSYNFGCQATLKTQTVTVNDSMVLAVEPGDNWQGKIKVFIFSVKKTPQLAAWVEDDNGNYISSIMATKRSAQKSWRSAPEEGRPEALPVWNHRQKNNQRAGELDTISTATPKGFTEAKIDNDSFVNGNTYNVFLEINHSFDYNDTWTESNSGVNGQPSIIYKAKFTAGIGANTELEPIGHGSVDGSDGTITSELNNLSTALEIIKNARLIVKKN